MSVYFFKLKSILEKANKLEFYYSQEIDNYLKLDNKKVYSSIVNKSYSTKVIRPLVFYYLLFLFLIRDIYNKEIFILRERNRNIFNVKLKFFYGILSSKEVILDIESLKLMINQLYSLYRMQKTVDSIIDIFYKILYMKKKYFIKFSFEKFLIYFDFLKIHTLQSIFGYLKNSYNSELVCRYLKLENKKIKKDLLKLNIIGKERFFNKEFYTINSAASSIHAKKLVESNLSLKNKRLLFYYESDKYLNYVFYFIKDDFLEFKRLMDHLNSVSVKHHFVYSFNENNLNLFLKIKKEKKKYLFILKRIDLKKDINVNKLIFKAF